MSSREALFFNITLKILVSPIRLDERITTEEAYQTIF